jgi:hypothetical protein
MKRISLVAALLGAIVLAFAGIAMASTAPAGTVIKNTGKSAQTGASQNGTAVTHYTANYTDSVFGPVSCTGQNQTKAKPAVNQDTFTCTSTSGLPLTSVSAGDVINWGPNTWLSDVNGTSLDQTFTATVSADGMSYTAVANY